MNWALTRPRTPSASTIRSIVATIRPWSPSLTVCGGNMPTESPEWSPGPLDVLQQPGDQDIEAVGDGVDVDLDALEVPVDPDGPIRIHDRRDRRLPLEVLGRVAEVDREPADDERRPDDDRVARSAGRASAPPRPCTIPQLPGCRAVAGTADRVRCLGSRSIAWRSNPAAGSPPPARRRRGRGRLSAEGAARQRAGCPAAVPASMTLLVFCT